MNIKEIIGNVAMVGGLITAGGSLVDGVIAPLFDKELQQRIALREQLQEKYDVYTECSGVSGGFLPTGSCFTKVEGNYSGPEKEEILDRYFQEFEEGAGSIPQDPIAQSRYIRDIAGTFGGLLIAGMGESVRQKKK